ncbi:hypothetical protein [Sphingobium yanoikuyae]|uniref:hypothetical protein n=1 Tax=Sphingobium yanoikuyae TaxID=13690 RepID=UPI0028AD2EC7|nr:hypothetical protein [Sphingobium yanoikuyae]
MTNSVYAERSGLLLPLSPRIRVIHFLREAAKRKKEGMKSSEFSPIFLRSP